MGAVVVIVKYEALLTGPAECKAMSVVVPVRDFQLEATGRGPRNYWELEIVDQKPVGDTFTAKLWNAIETV